MINSYFHGLNLIQSWSFEFVAWCLCCVRQGHSIWSFKVKIWPIIATLWDFLVASLCDSWESRLNFNHNFKASQSQDCKCSKKYDTSHLKSSTSQSELSLNLRYHYSPYRIRRLYFCARNNLSLSNLKNRCGKNFDSVLFYPLLIVSTFRSKSEIGLSYRWLLRTKFLGLLYQKWLNKISWSWFRYSKKRIFQLLLWIQSRVHQGTRVNRRCCSTLSQSFYCRYRLGALI